MWTLPTNVSSAIWRSMSAFRPYFILLVCLGLPSIVEAAAVLSPSASLPRRSSISSVKRDEPLISRLINTVFDIEDAVTANASAATAYLRIASLAIALYDYIITMPGEWRLYAMQPSFFKMSRACVLFICVRYMSIAALVTSNWGFFGTGFSAEVCKHYQLVAPLTKLFAVLFSQIIVSIRTYAISRKERWVFWVLATLFIASMVPEFMGNVYKRIPVQNNVKNCTSGNIVKVAWVHYLAAVIFDAVAMGIATAYLLLHSPSLSLMSGLSRLMLKEGMAYFFILTAVNVLNLVLFRVSPIATQSSAACLGQAVTMIMSQRIILGLHDWRTTLGATSGQDAYELSNSGRNATGGGRFGYPSNTSRAVANANGFPDTHAPTPNSRSALKSFVSDFTRSNNGNEPTSPREGFIQVKVDEEVKTDYDSLYNASPIDPLPAAKGDQKAHWSVM